LIAISCDSPDFAGDGSSDEVGFVDHGLERILDAPTQALELLFTDARDVPFGIRESSP